MSRTVTERRKSDRKKTFRAAVTLFESPSSPMPCIVMDISATGARIKALSADELPNEFLLTIESTMAQHQCKVVWRVGDELGIHFMA